MTAPPSRQPHADGGGPPRTYRLLVPEGWFRVDLDPDRAPGAVRALAARQFPGGDQLAQLRREFVDLLDRQCAQAQSIGGIEMYVATNSVGPLPLAASLVIVLLPEPPPGTPPLGPTEWRDELRADGHDADLVDLPAGTGVRTQTRTPPEPDDPLGRTLPTTGVEIRVPVPGSGAWLLMSFSTPVEPLADAFVALFDAVAGSLAWVD